MPHALSFRGGGHRRDYRDAGEHLAAVGADNLRAQSFRYFHGKGRLPGGSRPCDYYECIGKPSHFPATILQMLTITSEAFSIDWIDTYS